MAEVTDPIWPKVSSLDPFLAAVWKTNMRNMTPVWITHTATDEQEKNPNPQRRLRFGAGAGFPRLRTSIGFGRAGLMISALGSSPAMVRRCALKSSRGIAASCSRWSVAPWSHLRVGEEIYMIHLAAAADSFGAREAAIFSKRGSPRSGSQKGNNFSAP